MDITLKEQFVDKHAPKTIDEMVLDQKLKTIFKNMIEKKTVGNLLLYGQQGIGKTSLMNLITKGVEAEYLYINAAYDNSVEVVRGKVIDFCQAAFPKGVIKLVLIDEFDAMKGDPRPNEGAAISTGTSAQGSLKNVIEEHSDDTRFILTCNNLNRIIDPIKSRCTPVILNFSKTDVLKRISTILLTEQVTFKEEVLRDFVNDVMLKFMPDIRAIINTLEYWIEDNVMVNPKLKMEAKINEVTNTILSVKDPRQIRKYLIENEDIFNRDYHYLGVQLFEKLLDDQKACLTIADGLYKMAIVNDPEIQFHSMLIKLKNDN